MESSLAGWAKLRPDQRGFSLIEVMVATIIAVICVMGLAHSFGIGRALINRFETRRDALALAQARIEILSRMPLDAPDLSIGTHGPTSVPINAGMLGDETWTVVWVNDPADGTPDLDPQDYKRVTEAISWASGGIPDTISLSRQFLKP
jgi:prepilin-type N-terminal cleavage/methylation domain-containing protein